MLFLTRQSTFNLRAIEKFKNSKVLYIILSSGIQYKNVQIPYKMPVSKALLVGNVHSVLLRSTAHPVTSKQSEVLKKY